MAMHEIIEDLLIIKIKQEYMRLDVIMPELLRNKEYSSLSNDAKQHLLI